MNHKNIFKVNVSGNMLFVLCFLLMFVLALPAKASAGPVILYTDILSGPNTGGENNNGIYLSIFGKNFGSSSQLGTTTKVYINDIEVADYKYLGPSRVYDSHGIQQISIQPGGSVTSGSIKVVVDGVSSNTDQTFTVRGGDIYFVALDGNDSTGEIGDINRPFRNAQDTYNRADFGAGDTIVIRGGTWPRGSQFITSYNNIKNGAVNNEIAIVGYPGEQIYGYCTAGAGSSGTNAFEIYGSYWIISNIHYDLNKCRKNAINIRSDVVWTRLVNNELEGMGGSPGNGLINTGGTHSSDTKVYGNYLHDVGDDRRDHGIYMGRTRRTDVGWNHISRIGVEGEYEGGNAIQFRQVLDYEYRNQDVLIHDNVVHHATRGGILISEGSGDGLKIYNNVFYHNANSTAEKDYMQSALRITTDDRQSTIHVEIYNNTFYDSDSLRKTSGALRLTGIDSMIYKNNIVYALSDQPYTYDKGVPTVVESSNNIWYGSGVQDPPSWDPSPIKLDPKFINPTSYDFHLLEGSPAIDAGVEILDLLKDFDGNPRPMDGNSDGNAEYDIGANEYTGTYIPRNNTPSAPSDLRKGFK